MQRTVRDFVFRRGEKWKFLHANINNNNNGDGNGKILRTAAFRDYRMEICTMKENDAIKKKETRDREVGW